MKFFKKINILKLFFLFSTWNLFSEQISGYVYYNQKPISDVNILIKNSFHSTTSDENGKFTLDVNIGDIIVFSHVVAETKEIKVNNFNSKKIKLKQKLNNLYEVKITSVNKELKKDKTQKVYTAFGTINLRGVGYRVYSINIQDIRNSAAELPQTLMGRIPIINSVTNQGVILRNGRYALWDIDGMLFQGLPPYIDTRLIESIYVIPGGAGTVMYGSRGVGGVIVVNTINYRSKINRTYHPRLKYLNPDKIDLPYKQENISKIFNTEINSDSLRLMSFIYKNNNNNLALRINRWLLAKEPNNIKSYRDVAESLLQLNKKNEAWNLYKIFLLKKINEIDKSSFDIIYHDMERFYHSFGMKKIIGKGFESQKKIFKNYKNETRIVFEWTVPNEMIAIEILNPKNELIKLQLGNNFNENSRIEEIFIDETLKGNWVLNLSILGENLDLKGYLKVTIYKNWIFANSNPPEAKIFFLENLDLSKYKLINFKI